MKRISIGGLSLLALIVAVGLLRGLQPAYAQGQLEPGKINIYRSDHGFYATLSRNSVLVQTGRAASGDFCVLAPVPEGDYELHLEAAGYKNQVMRVHVVAGQTSFFSSDSPKGEGTQVWGKGPTLAELIERIAKLEKQIDELKKKNP